VALPWAAAYCASKYAVHCITDSLRRELRRDGIRVMKICPGIVSTDFRKHVLQGAAPASVASLRFVVSAESVATAVLKGIESGSSRTIYVPAIGRIFSALSFVPPLMDLYLERFAPAPAPRFISVNPVASSQIESERV
jgi:short-subunit dehydrogenase